MFIITFVQNRTFAPCLVQLFSNCHWHTKSLLGFLFSILLSVFDPVTEKKIASVVSTGSPLPSFHTLVIWCIVDVTQQRTGFDSFFFFFLLYLCWNAAWIVKCAPWTLSRRQPGEHLRPDCVGPRFCENTVRCGRTPATRWWTQIAHAQNRQVKADSSSAGCMFELSHESPTGVSNEHFKLLLSVKTNQEVLSTNYGKLNLTNLEVPGVKMISLLFLVFLAWSAH